MAIYFVIGFIAVAVVLIWLALNFGFPWLAQGGKPSNIKEAVENGKDLFSQNGGVVAVVAHPDDAEYYCGGSLAELAKRGHKVVVVVCTSEAGNTGKIRKHEQQRATEILGYQKVIFLDYPDRSLKANGKLVNQLKNIYQRENLNILFTFDSLKEGKVYHHPDHKAAGKAALQAAEGSDFSGIYLFHSGASNTWVELSEEVVNLKTEAMLAHRSQRPLGIPLVGNHIKKLAESEGQIVGLPYAEVFRKL